MSSTRNLSAFVVGVCLIVPMGMYADAESKSRQLMQELYLAQNNTPTEAKSFNFDNPPVLGGRGGPAVGIDAIVEPPVAGAGVLSAAGESIEIIRVDPQDESSFNTSENTKKLIHVKIAETVWPVEEVSISSDYGWRSPPCEGCSSDHRGVDFVPGAGTKVFSVYQGIVTAAGWFGGYGNHIVIKHYVQNDDGVIEEWETLYAHMQNNSIPENIYVGAVVRTGQEIGLVGNTGVSTGAHLHFELTIDGENIDPMPILGHYELVEMTEEELRDYAFDAGIPEMTFKID